MTSTLDNAAESGEGAVSGRRPVWRNDLLRRTRLALPSPSGCGWSMSRQELAEAANAFLAERGFKGFLNEKDIGRYERGETRWPRAHYRRALCQVLGASSDTALGFCKTRGRASDLLSPPPLPWGGDGLTATPPVRMVLHWNGRKAYALRLAMRMSIRDFAAKLGVSHAVVGAWGPEATGRLRFETHQILDAMLSRATDEDQQRFDIALAELGEVR